MVTLIVLLAAVALVVGAGEAVRGQCRRMLGRPIAPAVATESVAAEQPARALAA
ncbi:MAG TPA: hypothetical protein VGH43_12815 [Jatrophihabitans sp.]|jgi:hypothetical protein